VPAGSNCEATNTPMVRPHVEFANSVWCPYKIGDSKEIEKIQKRATKLVIKLKNKSYIGVSGKVIVDDKGIKDCWKEMDGETDE